VLHDTQTEAASAVATGDLHSDVAMLAQVPEEL